MPALALNEGEARQRPGRACRLVARQRRAARGSAWRALRPAAPTSLASARAPRDVRGCGTRHSGTKRIIRPTGERKRLMASGAESGAATASGPLGCR
eukprot:2207022-Pleurochrysis_carterae.AAC.3